MENRLTVVGLGPGDYRYLTLEADHVLQHSGAIYGRTARHPVMERLREQGKTVVTFDSLYETATDFDRLYDDIVEEIWRESLKAPVVYAVPGNPLASEQTVALLCRRAQAEGAALRIVPGAGCADAVTGLLGIDPAQGLTVADAAALPARPLEHPLLVYQIDSRLAAAQAKLKLMESYPDDHPVTVVQGAGITGRETCRTLPLYELDREELFDHVTTLCVPPLKAGELAGTLEELVGIMARLRSPEGCPWDLKQTHKSLLPYLVEEAYEVLDAVEAEDYGLMEEELGDLLLQIVFHSRIAEENGDFGIRDVLRGISEKMIRRHPHVFADAVAKTPEAVLVNWEAIKRDEKEESGHHAAMARIPRQLPALMRSWKIQKKAAEAGFDWDNVAGALEKVEEEFGELTELLDSGDRDRLEDEMGDLLFAVVNVARFLKVEPEQALNRTSDKFMKRYQYVEEQAANNGLIMQECGLEVLDRFWNEAKSLEKQQKVQKRT